MTNVILVSALGPNHSFFFFGGTFIQLGGLLGQELGLGLGLGPRQPRLDNFLSYQMAKAKSLKFILGFEK